jgi:hypothetical protein
MPQAHVLWAQHAAALHGVDYDSIIRNFARTTIDSIVAKAVQEYSILASHSLPTLSSCSQTVLAAACADLSPRPLTPTGSTGDVFRKMVDIRFRFKLQSQSPTHGRLWRMRRAARQSCPVHRRERQSSAASNRRRVRGLNSAASATAARTLGGAPAQARRPATHRSTRRGPAPPTGHGGSCSTRRSTL